MSGACHSPLATGHSRRPPKRSACNNPASPCIEVVVSLIYAVMQRAPGRAMCEFDLVSRVASGDPTALAALYEAHARELYALLYRITGTRAEAEDMLHDLFVGLPEALRGYQDRGQLRAWLKRVATRLALMHLRERRRSSPLPDLEREAPGRADASAERLTLRDAVLALPASLRVVFVLKHIEGYSHEEIARLLGITPGASRVRHSRALHTLRRTLTD
jgi:RNA polymerase sigma-70 factor, ECF subfamily